MNEIEAKRKEVFTLFVLHKIGKYTGTTSENVFDRIVEFGREIERKEFLDFLEHDINPKHCGCDRCPSCRIMQENKVKELKQSLEEKHDN